MKKETKELIQWIKDHLSHYRNQLAAGQIKVGLATGEKEVKNAYEAINFLNSLPEIESRLCRGGYIQDKNGSPCCDGDLVHFLSKSQNEKYGYLKWDKKLARFLLEVAGESDCRYIMPEIEWFEKVKFHEVQSYKDIE